MPAHSPLSGRARKLSKCEFTPGYFLTTLRLGSTQAFGIWQAFKQAPAVADGVHAEHGTAVAIAGIVIGSAAAVTGDMAHLACDPGPWGCRDPCDAMPHRPSSSVILV